MSISCWRGTFVGAVMYVGMMYMQKRPELPRAFHKSCQSSVFTLVATYFVAFSSGL